MKLKLRLSSFDQGHLPIHIAVIEFAEIFHPSFCSCILDGIVFVFVVYYASLINIVCCCECLDYLKINSRCWSPFSHILVRIICGGNYSWLVSRLFSTVCNYYCPRYLPSFIAVFSRARFKYSLLLFSVLHLFQYFVNSAVHSESLTCLKSKLQFKYILNRSHLGKLMS